jgi:hypothetical protein
MDAARQLTTTDSIYTHLFSGDNTTDMDNLNALRT